MTLRFSGSFLVNACMCLMAHINTEGLFRKSGSVVRLKALKVRNGLKLSQQPLKLPRLAIRKDCNSVFDCLGQSGRWWGVPVRRAPLWRRWAGEAVLQGAAGACAPHRTAGGLYQGPAASHRGGAHLSHHAALRRAAGQKYRHSAPLFRLPPRCVQEVAKSSVHTPWWCFFFFLFTWTPC